MAAVTQIAFECCIQTIINPSQTLHPLRPRFINGVNPVYRTLSPMLKGLTVLSYNR